MSSPNNAVDLTHESRSLSTVTQGTNSEAAGSPLGAQDDIARFLQRHGVQPMSSPTTPALDTSTKSGAPASPKIAGDQIDLTQASGISSPTHLTVKEQGAKTRVKSSGSDAFPTTTSSTPSSPNKEAVVAGSPNKVNTKSSGSPTTAAAGDGSNKSASSPSPSSSATSSPKKVDQKSSSGVISGGVESSSGSSKEKKQEHDELVPWSDVYDSACVAIEGNPADLWSIDDYADESDPNVFSYPTYSSGGGLARNQHMTLLQSIGFDLAQVPFTPCHPYLKEAPPTGLPLESFDLRVIYDAGRTGFEDNKEFSIAPGTIIAGRYKITEYIGSAAFSRAVQAIDLKHNAYVCIKIVRNSKDFFDQALDEIKLLHYINCNGDPDENHVVQLYDFFYYKEHVFLVCELLRDNLYEFGKYNREHESEPYFTLPRLQKITKQILRALAYVHSLNLLHCDLKPENVLIKSYSRCEIKVIDFGSSCFTTDNLSSYIQSRCYRAPEVVLGCKYDGRIDIWSLGAMIPELATGHVLFHNDTLAQMLGRTSALLGPFPTRMVREGRHSCRYITKSGLFYELTSPNTDEEGGKTTTAPEQDEEKLMFYYPKPRPLEEMCGYDNDAEYLDFIKQCLMVDHTLRPTAIELLGHPWMTKVYPESEQQIATLAQQQVSAMASSSSTSPGGKDNIKKDASSSSEKKA